MTVKELIKQLLERSMDAKYIILDDKLIIQDKTAHERNNCFIYMS